MPAGFPIAALIIVPPLTTTAAIINIIAAARIIKSVIPAQTRPIAAAPIGIIGSAAIIAGTDIHATIAIAIIIGATAQSECTDKAQSGEKLSSRPHHRRTPYI